jgi:hypothetical protein
MKISRLCIIALAPLLIGCFGESTSVAPKARQMGDYIVNNGLTFWQLVAVLGIFAGAGILLWVIDLGREFFATRKRAN